MMLLWTKAVLECGSGCRQAVEYSYTHAWQTTLWEQQTVQV